jgi:hypothetical protein
MATKRRKKSEGDEAFKAPVGARTILAVRTDPFLCLLVAKVLAEKSGNISE